MNLTPGTTLAAVEALQTQETFNRAQVAYLIAVAYEVGRRHTMADDLAETIACWDEHATPAVTREARIAARIAAMEAEHRSSYTGGPVDWETGQPLHTSEVAA